VCDWLAVITRINPFTCAVDPLRHLVFALLDMPAAAAARFAADVSCSDTPLPIALELGITCPLAAVLLTLAVTGFGKLE
jgi:ABC-2 type transport system permease protein